MISFNMFAVLCKAAEDSLETRVHLSFWIQGLNAVTVGLKFDPLAINLWIDADMFVYMAS